MAKPQKTEAATKTLTPATIDAGTGEVLPSKLSKDEVEELERCETVIRKGWGTFLDVGRALATIRDKGLFKGKYDTFDLYWKRELGVSRSYAYSLIESAAVNDQMSAIADIGVKPLNEAQLRELIPVKEDRRIDAWKRAVELAGDKPITAKIVRKAALKFKPRRSGKAKIKRAGVVKIDVELGLKLLAKVEKAAEQNKDQAILKELAGLREWLEELAG
jgi:hypothetical protein